MSSSQIPGAQQLLQQIQPQNLGGIQSTVGGAPPITPQATGQSQSQGGPLGGNTLQSVQQLVNALGQGQGQGSPGVGAATPNVQAPPGAGQSANAAGLVPSGQQGIGSGDFSLGDLGKLNGLF